MPRRKKLQEPVTETPLGRKMCRCLGWCKKEIPFTHAGDRFCGKCRDIKLARQRGMSKMELECLPTTGDYQAKIAALIGDSHG